MQIKVKRFYKSQRDFKEFYFHLKQTPCPDCKLVGALILHGYLSGYDEKVYGKRTVRGHRIFCSNRGRRRGCGKTFSVVRENILKNFNISAESFWYFLRNIARGMSKIQAFRSLKLSFSDSTAYRLLRRFSYSQSRLRTFLFRLSKPPRLSKAANLIIQTFLHLRYTFPKSPCPISAFQQHFQVSFL